jgi:hypothetical protein
VRGSKVEGCKRDIYIHGQTTASASPSAIFTAGKYDGNLSLNSSVSRFLPSCFQLYLFAPPACSYSHPTPCDNPIHISVSRDERIPRNHSRDVADLRERGKSALRDGDEKSSQTGRKGRIAVTWEQSALKYSRCNTLRANKSTLDDL